MIIENLDFNGSNDILQYIPEVPEVNAPPPPEERPQPVFQTRTLDPVESFKPEIKNSKIEMDFSTPISDVVPSAEFNMPESNFAPSGGQGSYKNPQNNRVAGLSLDTTPVAAPPSKNPLGLTDEQLSAALAGVAAVLVFSKPVQLKLSNIIPKFALSSGDLSLTGMIASAFVTAVLYFLAMKMIKKT
jgi:hypothetical protein